MNADEHRLEVYIRETRWVGFFSWQRLVRYPHEHAHTALPGILARLRDHPYNCAGLMTACPETAHAAPGTARTRQVVDRCWVESWAHSSIWYPSRMYSATA